MFKTFAAVLIAASMLTAPALAQGTSSAPATQMTKAPAVKVVKVKKHSVKKHHAHVRKHVRHVRYARHHGRYVGRHHVKHVSAKPAHVVHAVGSAPKARTN